MSRIIGLRDLYIAELLTDDGVEKPTWGAATKVPSLISLDVQDNSESVTFYSDDTAEQVIQAYTGKEVSIELGYLTNEIEAKISGNTYDPTTGFYSQNANAQAKEIALMFRAPKSKGNAFQYVVLYKGVLAREGASYKTKEDKTESSNVTLKGVFMPLAYNGDVSAKIDTDSGTNTQLVNKWFTAPVLSDDIAALSTLSSTKTK